jgi:hypothetical protein
VLLDGRQGVTAAILQRADVLLEVLAHAEGASAADQQHGSYGFVGRRLAEGVAKFRFELVVERVHRIRAVEGDRRETLVHVVEHGVRHGHSMA